MTAISVKRWIVLLVGLVLFLGAGIALQKYQVKKLARSVASDADIAAEKGEFEKAESLYEQHLNVIPDDVDIQIKYADILAKVAPSLSRQSEALQIYGDILRRFPGRDEVRRRQMELKFAMNRLQDDGAEADLKVLLKLPKYQEDGNLMFMLARCYEEGKNYTSAAQFYENAIKHNAQQKIEAYARLANLLRSPERLNDPKAGDKAIEEMVKSAPDNYAAYLARGRYRSKFNLPGSRADFEKALTLADDKPEIYAELSRIAESELGYLEAKKILETGLSKFPASAELYVMLSDLEQRNGHTEAAIAILERGVQSPAEKTAIRWLLAISLATRGDTGKLRLQIEELRASGISQIALQYLTAHYHANLADYRKARQILIPLESAPGLRPEFKSRISNLLARCYSQLGEPAMQHEAYVRALSANPNDVNAKLGLIDRMIKQGDLEEAIKEYRSLAKIAPGVNIPLAQQLIARNLQRPVAQRDWTEVKTAIDHAEKALPESAEPLILRADYFIAQEQRPLAREELAKARKRFPKSAAVRCAEANLLVNEKKIDEAVGVLDDARKELGDGLELRLQRAKLAVLRGGPQVVA
jgi:tetratricopeptide (TPR) repeat protein